MKIVAPHNHRILIVDGEEDIRTALINSLTHRMYHCVAADHGESAFRCLDINRFHLVISDYQMPVKNGLQFLEALKQDPSRAVPPVILMTADMSKDLRRQALALGVYAVIDKPFASQELAALAARAIESREIGQKGFSEMRSE